MAAIAASRGAPHVLVLGGSCFMGKLLCEQLTATMGCIVVIRVNRGRQYWRQPSVRNSPNHVRADRSEPEMYREAVREAVSVAGENVVWLGVVDMCGFTVEDVTTALPDILFNRAIFPKYIFISTDSVYEVIAGISKIGEKVVEGVTSPVGVAELKAKRDKYGFNKLLAERALEARSSGAVTILRLPDVIGPFDDTSRFWAAKLWVESGVSFVSTEDDRKVPLAFVYSGDVVEVIRQILRAEESVSGVFNIGCEEQVCMQAFLGVMGQELGRAVEFKDSGMKALQKRYYPSVEWRRTELSFEKAKSVLQFRPTPLRTVVRETVDWCRKAEEEFPEELRETVSDLPRVVREKILLKFGIDSSSGDDSSSSSSSSTQ